MKLPKRIIIRVPGTSANLGPGFDILGMALKVYNHFDFTFNDKLGYNVSLKNGQTVPFSQEEDLTLYSYNQYSKIFLNDKSFPTYQCKMELELPMKGGLGSSASAVVAGFCLAREVHRYLFTEIALPSEGRFLYELAMQEGHPDNTSPAYLGGYVLSYFDRKDHLSYYKKKFPKSTAIYYLTPHLEVSTSESRKVLPKSYSTEDMIFNMTRMATWIQYFETRRFSDLKLALQDKMHTPYRIPEIPSLNEIIKIVEKKQMAYCLSGSGPTILIFMERKKVSQLENAFIKEIDECMKQIGIKYTLRKILSCEDGVQITKK
jgi:homoserine kinase